MKLFRVNSKHLKKVLKENKFKPDTWITETLYALCEIPDTDILEGYYNKHGRIKLKNYFKSIAFDKNFFIDIKGKYFMRILITLLLISFIGCGKKNTTIVTAPDASIDAVCEYFVYSNGQVTICNQEYGLVLQNGVETNLTKIIHPCSKKINLILYRTENSLLRVKNNYLYHISPGWYHESCKYYVDSDFNVTGYKPE